MARLQQGRRSQFKSGWLDCVNIQAGTVDVTCASTGETAVVFPKPFKNNHTPTIILCSIESLADASIMSAKTPTAAGFTAQLACSAAATYTLNWLAVDNQYPTKRGGIHSGWVKCANIQSGYEQIVTDGSGDGTAKAVVFDAPFKNVPIVLLTVQEAVTTGKPWFSSAPTRNGFTMDVTGSDVTTGDILVGWVAIDMEVMDAQGNTLSDNLEVSGDFKSNFRNHKAGFHSGYLRAYNMQAGYNTIATDGSGDGTAEAITFSRRMGRSGSLQRTPIVFAEPQETDATGNVLITSQADTGFTLDVTDSAVISGNLTVGWFAICTSAVLTD